MHGSPPSSQSEDENFEITLATTAPEVHMFQYKHKRSAKINVKIHHRT